MAAPVKQIVTKVPIWEQVLVKWVFRNCYFTEIGLLTDDCLHETPEVKEAIRRLPDNVYDKRMFRISRALLLSGKKQVLPRDEWTKWEQDERYLKPFIDRVLKEKKEKQEWDMK